MSRGDFSPTGLKARTDNDTVVATVPPRDPAVDECEFLWVVTEDNWIEPL